MLTIYGGSDDLVEIEGDVSDEIGCCDGEVMLVVGHEEARAGENSGGVRVIMRYAPGEEAVWSAELSPLDEDAPIPWPVNVTAEGYSIRVNVQCPPDTPLAISTRKAGKGSAWKPWKSGDDEEG